MYPGDCLNQYSSLVDIKTVESCWDYFIKSIDNDLKSKVVEDMIELDTSKRGPITMYLSIIKHMVASNAESCKATAKWVCKSNILNFNGKM